MQAKRPETDHLMSYIIMQEFVYCAKICIGLWRTSYIFNLVLVPTR